MKSLVRLLFFLFMLCGMSVFADVYDPAYYNSQEYFHKDEIIKNDFFPVMRLAEFVEGYKENMPQEGKKLQYVNIQIDDQDWEAMMTHYFSDKRFTGKETFPVTATFTHEGIDEIINATIRHRGNYSTRSLKVGFRLELNRALQHGIFRDKTRLVFRHLVFDQTGINEKVYYDAWKKIHAETLGFDPLVPASDYFWVFINDRLYGYYLVLNDSTPELLMNRGELFDHASDCLIKAKTWAQDMSADMHYDRLYDTDAGFEKVYTFEGGDREKCIDEVVQMTRDLDAGKAQKVLAQFRDPRQIAYQAQMVDRTNNRTGVHQNYLLIKHNNLWEIAPWDADLTFDTEQSVDTSFLLENALFAAAIVQHPDILPEILEKYVAQFFRTYSDMYASSVATDRKVWARYLPRRDRHIPEVYASYIVPEYRPDSIADYMKILSRSTYRNIITRYF